MNREFEECLQRGGLRRFPKGVRLFQKELRAAEADLAQAKRTFKTAGYKWGTIQGYYAMFHAARALLYFRSYRERSHHCLVVGIRALFVTERLLDPTLVEALQLGKRLRENADYYDEFSEHGARKMMETAKKFLEQARSLIGDLRKSEKKS